MQILMNYLGLKSVLNRHKRGHRIWTH